MNVTIQSAASTTLLALSLNEPLANSSERNALEGCVRK